MNQVYVGLDLGSSIFQPAAINHEGVKTMNHSFPDQRNKRAQRLCETAQRESQTLEWLQGSSPTVREGSTKAKPKTVSKMVLRLTTWLLANNSMTQLETPAGVS